MSGGVSSQTSNKGSGMPSCMGSVPGGLWSVSWQDHAFCPVIGCAESRTRMLRCARSGPATSVWRALSVRFRKGGSFFGRREAVRPEWTVRRVTGPGSVPCRAHPLSKQTMPDGRSPAGRGAWSRGPHEHRCSARPSGPADVAGRAGRGRAGERPRHRHRLRRGGRDGRSGVGAVGGVLGCPAVQQPPGSPRACAPPVRRAAGPAHRRARARHRLGPARVAPLGADVSGRAGRVRAGADGRVPAQEGGEGSAAAPSPPWGDRRAHRLLVPGGSRRRGLFSARAVAGRTSGSAWPTLHDAGEHGGHQLVDGCRGRWVGGAVREQEMPASDQGEGE